MKDDQSITIQRILITSIDPFPFQARKHFSESGLEELAASVATHGVLQPLLGRPNPNNLQRVQLVAGERRLRAASKAGLLEVPVIVRDISDTDAEEMMLTENLQREDLTPVEEADALWRMLQLKNDDDSPRYTLVSLAAKLGKGEFEIRQAIKLRGAPAKLLDAVERKEVPVSVAAVVGRIPDPKAREAAAQAILFPKTQPVPLNYAQAAHLIRSEFMAKIPGAGFDPKDAELVPLKLEKGERVCGGSCEDCPFRSGNLPDIAEQLQGAVEGGKGRKAGGTSGVDPHLCTKPSCHALKQDAQWERTKTAHLKDGGKVLSDAEAKREFSDWQGGLRYDSNYAEPGDDIRSQFFGRHLDKKWSQVIAGLPVSWVLARHPKTRKAVKLLDGKATAELVKAKMKEDGPSEEDARGVERMKEQRAKELLEQKVDKAQWRMAFDAILQKVAARGLGVSELKLLFQIVLDNSGADGMTVMGQWLGIKLPKGTHHSGRDYEEDIIKRLTNEATTVNQILGWIVLASCGHGVKWAGAKSEDLTLVLEELGIDEKALKADATAQVKVAKKPEKKTESAPLVSKSKSASAARNAAVNDAAEKTEHKRNKGSLLPAEQAPKKKAGK